MKIPKTFIPEKNTEKSLEKILSKKLYTIDKEGQRILVHDFGGKFIRHKMIGEKMGCLETFSFCNKKMFTVKFGDDLDQRAFFDERLNPIIMTPRTKNQVYCVFERKNDTDLLMVNFTVDSNRYTKITFFNNDGTKFDDTYLDVYDTLTKNTFVVKTKEQNYLAFCFGHQTILLHEDLKKMMTIHTAHDLNEVSREVVGIYDKNFSLKDMVSVNGALLYEVVNFKEVSYFACIDDDNLEFYCDLPLGPASWSKSMPKKRIKLLNTKGTSLKRIIPFKYKSEDFLALEYGNNEGVYIYDENFNFVREFSGGDFCVA